ncbi:ABC transporter ATP-binding protein [Ruminiclostridium cellobioparum]|uniref:ABC-type multidrug transport system, ATPase and permease component n=1 Tax=Ruminiclostridium cellobioparum subsp. termitidis CT1112 TaxID=1195236 RepID=S0FJ99_RUMCE|nr:ABC transporter ATP-binding protein [Ruminiclostridium cellobioparum]EMS69194.1 ABC-type multidrug transport system, ATPase and permease component [Ruminiclostridium cellobioparum subsp. termitidis CT1112]
MNKNNSAPKEKTGVLRLLELAGSKKNKLLIACLLSVLTSAARLVPFFTIYGVIRELLAHYTAIGEVDTVKIYTLVGYTFAAALVYGICAFASSALAHDAAYDIIYELRLMLMEKLSRIPSGYFTGTTQGAIKKVISDDVEQIEVFIAHHIADMAAATATPVFTIVYLFIMDWRLALVTMVPILISTFLLSAGLKNPKGAQTQVDMHDTKERMEGTIVEYIHGMPVIKIFNRSLSAFRRYERDVSDYVETVERTAHHFAPGMGAYYAFFGAQLLFLLPASLLFIYTASSYLDFLPVILLFFLVGGGLKEPMENMMQMMVNSKRITEGVSRIDRILKQKELADGKTGNPSSCDITFSGVSFAYEQNGSQAVNNVSFHLQQGSVTGIVGPSGGGKSTLAQLLLGFYEPQAGTIQIGGVNIREIPQYRLMKLVSYVFQDSFLFHDTVENNIRMGDRQATGEEVEQAARNAGIHEVIMALPMGYDTVIGEKDAYLSGGEKQRIAIARVFLKNAPIVILDEATAYADAENEANIQQAFARLAKNKTVLIIAHRLKTVENANRILVMKNGELLGEGTHTELLEHCPQYGNMIAANERRDRWTIRKEAALV